MRPHNRKRSFILLLVVLQVALVAVALEVTVRVLSKRNRTIKTLSYNAAYSGNYQDKKTLEELLTATSFGYQPFYPAAGFKLNSKGFRTGEYADRKPKGTYRICVLGDSFAFASGGVPYGKMWTTLVEKDLRTSVSKRIELINLGIMAVGPLFEFRLWQLEGSKLDADLVILAFFVGNDFVDGSQLSASGSSRIDKIADRSYLVRVFRNWRRFKAAEANETAIAEQIEAMAGREIGRDSGRTDSRHKHNDKELRAGVVEGYRYDEGAKFSELTYRSMVSQRMSIVLQPNREYFDRLYRGVADLLVEFHGAVTSSGARFLLMLIPDDYQVDRGVFRDGVEWAKKYPPSDYDIDMPQARLIELCKKHGIDYLDLLPLFRERGKTAQLYRLRDTHWNLEGNALAAELLADKFRSDYASGVGRRGAAVSE